MQLQVIQQKIFEIRDQKVMLDFDLGELYVVETKVLNQAVKRNIERFPADFMFRLTKKEWNDLRSQIVTSSRKHRGATYLPYAFTEHGITMNRIYEAIENLLDNKTDKQIEKQLWKTRERIGFQK